MFSRVDIFSPTINSYNLKIYGLFKFFFYLTYLNSLFETTKKLRWNVGFEIVRIDYGQKIFEPFNTGLDWLRIYKYKFGFIENHLKIGKKLEHFKHKKWKRKAKKSRQVNIYNFI